MKNFKMCSVNVLVFWLVAAFLPVAVRAWEPPDPKTYVPTQTQIKQAKARFDDPRKIVDTYSFKKVVPPDLYERLTYDIDKMKEVWAECVGFKSPDVVGKIAPEIKPGKYTYQDLEKYPGLKELFFPEMLNRIKPGAPPFAGNIAEFEIVPTENKYYAIPIAEATLKNKGKTKLDDKGYIIDNTWEAGYPFPRPSGKFMAQEVVFNPYRSYAYFGQCQSLPLNWVMGFDKNLKLDLDMTGDNNRASMSGRVQIPPLGFYDARAKERNESLVTLDVFSEPRDFNGTVISTCYRRSAYEADQTLTWVSAFRRIRKMSSTDTQDPLMGMDIIYDDRDFFTQKLSPDKYPYSYKVIADREYLFPDLGGSSYVTSKELEFRNVKMSRRPVYVVELTQLDHGYVYSKRILYIDKEILAPLALINFDQKGRVYRASYNQLSFYPEMGASFYQGFQVYHDFVDLHSTLNLSVAFPAFFTRDALNSRPFLSIQSNP